MVLAAMIHSLVITSIAHAMDGVVVTASLHFTADAVAVGLAGLADLVALADMTPSSTIMMYGKLRNTGLLLKLSSAKA